MDVLLRIKRLALQGRVRFTVKAKEEMKATIRVIPDEEFRSSTAPSSCIGGGGPSRMEVVWARAY